MVKHINLSLQTTKYIKSIHVKLTVYETWSTILKTGLQNSTNFKAEICFKGLISQSQVTSSVQWFFFSRFTLTYAAPNPVDMSCLLVHVVWFKKQIVLTFWNKNTFIFWQMFRKNQRHQRTTNWIILTWNVVLPCSLRMHLGSHSQLLPCFRFSCLISYC